MDLPENPSRSQARDLFLQALEKPSPAERAAFLDGVCAGDARQRAAVEELLGPVDIASGCPFEQVKA